MSYDIIVGIAEDGRLLISPLGSSFNRLYFFITLYLRGFIGAPSDSLATGTKLVKA